MTDSSDSQPKGRERRKFPRQEQLTGLWPGRLTDEKKAQNVAIKPTDVSRDGIGGVAPVQMIPGTMLWLLLPDRAIKLEVVYCQADFMKQGLFRVGLERRESMDNLESVFSAGGCLK